MDLNYRDAGLSDMEPLLNLLLKENRLTAAEAKIERHLRASLEMRDLVVVVEPRRRPGELTGALIGGVEDGRPLIVVRDESERAEEIRDGLEAILEAERPRRLAERRALIKSTSAQGQ